MPSRQATSDDHRLDNQYASLELPAKNDGTLAPEAFNPLNPNNTQSSDFDQGMATYLDFTQPVPYAGLENYQPNPEQQGIDWMFIHLAEVSREKKNGVMGYGAEKGTGVTIATGLDLTQWDDKDLAKLKEFGLSDELIGKLSKIAGPWTAEKEQLANALTKEEIIKINCAYLAQVKQDITRKFNKEADHLEGATHFSDLPSQAQTVLMSIGIQNRAFLNSPYKEVILAIMRGDYPDAIKKLEKKAEKKSGGIKNRRLAEIRFLRSIPQKGSK